LPLRLLYGGERIIRITRAFYKAENKTDVNPKHFNSKPVHHDICHEDIELASDAHAHSGRHCDDLLLAKPLSVSPKLQQLVKP
jgi:hypothetical protein